MQADGIDMIACELQDILSSFTYLNSLEGSKIEIILSTSQEHVMIHVMDQGNGIPENEKQRIFEKFYRIGNEDTRRTKGTGLGLFIVQHIVNLHKGAIKVRDNYPQGSIFEIKFPTVN